MFEFFYSDPHFGHANIIAHAGRPFDDVEEMDRELERRYCEYVSVNDSVLWCGDVSFRDAEWTRALLKRLPGQKLLLRGNHDGTVSACLKLGFDFVADQLAIQIAGHKVTCSHYPPWSSTLDMRHAERRPPLPQKGEYVLHGHSHEPQRFIGRRIHVGVDAWNFYPASWTSIEAEIRKP